MTKHDVRRIKSLAETGQKFARQIRDELKLPVSTRRVQQILHADSNFVWTKRQVEPKLLQRHKDARILYARDKMSWTTEWTFVVFSDEKKFNLDGPDGCQFYWHNLKNEKQVSKN